MNETDIEILCALTITGEICVSILKAHTHRRILFSSTLTDRSSEKPFLCHRVTVDELIKLVDVLKASIPREKKSERSWKKVYMIEDALENLKIGGNVDIALKRIGEIVAYNGNL